MTEGNSEESSSPAALLYALKQYVECLVTLARLHDEHSRAIPGVTKGMVQEYRASTVDVVREKFLAALKQQSRGPLEYLNNLLGTLGVGLLGQALKQQIKNLKYDSKVRQLFESDDTGELKAVFEALGINL